MRLGQGLLPGCKEASRRADRKAAECESARLRGLSSRPSGGSVLGNRLSRRDAPEKVREEMMHAEVGCMHACTPPSPSFCLPGWLLL